MDAPRPDPASTRCPLCNKPLATDEYERAVAEMEDRIRQRYSQDLEAERGAAAQKAKESEERHGAELERLRAEHEKSKAELQKSMEDGQAKQLASLEKHYEKMSAQSSKQFDALEKRLKEQHRKELAARDKRAAAAEKRSRDEHRKEVAERSRQAAAAEKRSRDEHRKEVAERSRQAAAAEKRSRDEHRKEVAERDRQIKDLKRLQANAKRAAAEEARTKFDSERRKLHEELTAKNVQLERVKGKVGQLEAQLEQSQSELKGEAGELDLYAALSAAFPDDQIKRQKRGTSSGDLVQRIRSKAGFLDTTIVYDNKSAATVTKADIAKAQKYKSIHGTEYVIVVSSSLPKRSVPNGLVGEKDGILLVHPSIIAEVARQIRSGIVEVSRYSLGGADRDSKQARLYDYIISTEFASTIEAIASVMEQAAALQSKEERDHQTLWKSRKALNERLTRLYSDVSSGIESITHDGLSVEPLTAGGGNGDTGPSLVVRRAGRDDGAGGSRSAA